MYGLNEVFTFGKYRGKSISEVLEANPKYLEWAIENVSNFTLDEKALDLLRQKTS